MSVTMMRTPKISIPLPTIRDRVIDYRFRVS